MSTESVGFEETNTEKLLLSEKVTQSRLLMTAQIKVSPEALNIIESSRRFRRSQGLYWDR
jgi:hypothetical protein